MVEQISSTNLIAKQQHVNDNTQKIASSDVKINQQPQADTVELSTKQQIKNKVSKLSTAQKIGIVSAALVAGVVATVVTQKATYINRAQKIFENAFMKDFSREDTINLLNKFKDISKITDNKEYITELFNLGRKEYGLENLDIELKFADLQKGKKGCMGGINVRLELFVDPKAKRKDFVNIIFHELRHAKQNDMMYSADSDRFIRTLFKRKSIKDALRNDEGLMSLVEENGLSFEQNFDKIVNLIMELNLMKPIFRNKGYGQIKIDPKHNEFVEKLLKASDVYDDGDFVKYYFNFLEQDARKAGQGISKITRHIPENLN